MQKKHDYVAILDRARIEQEMSLTQLAARAKISAQLLRRVFRYDTHLTREQIFYVGKALKFSAIDMEKLALLVVLASAQGREFKSHILQKLSRIEKIRVEFSWVDYIRSTLPAQKEKKATRRKA